MGLDSDDRSGPAGITTGGSGLVYYALFALVVLLFVVFVLL